MPPASGRGNQTRLATAATTDCCLLRREGEGRRAGRASPAGVVLAEESEDRSEAGPVRAPGDGLQWADKHHIIVGSDGRNISPREQRVIRPSAQSLACSSASEWAVHDTPATIDPLRSAHAAAMSAGAAPAATSRSRFSIFSRLRSSSERVARAW